jgi:hypothetical protein
MKLIAMNCCIVEMYNAKNNILLYANYVNLFKMKLLFSMPLHIST